MRVDMKDGLDFTRASGRISCASCLEPASRLYLMSKYREHAVSMVLDVSFFILVNMPRIAFI